MAEKDRISRIMLFQGRGIVTILSTTDLLNEAIRIHKLTKTSAAALGRVLTVAAFISSGFKSQKYSMSITIDGGGPLGKIVATGNYGAKVRGYVQHPGIDLPLRKDKKINVGKAVGKDGFLTVIKDFNMKKPYGGEIKLVSGEIAEDFAHYFAKSEQLPTAIALGVLMKKDKCISSGGIVIQPMPNAKEEDIQKLEKVAGKFSNISAILDEKTHEEIVDEYFKDCEPVVLTPSYPEYACTCSLDKIKKVVKMLGRREAEQIIKEQGKIEVHCKFCNKFYYAGAEDLDEIFKDE